MVRKARVKDVAVIKQLIDFASGHGAILPRIAKEITENIGSFFVSEEGGKVVGCCGLDVYNWKLAEIRSLVVLPEYERRGIGSQLVRKCMDKAKKLHIYKLLSITKKDAFFETLGFSKCLNDQWPMFIKVTKKKNYL